jgi:DNA-binding NarL/FixJ family response regulator
MLLSLKRLLEPEFEVAGMADNVLSMLDALGDIRPDVLVMDTGSAEFGAGYLALHLQQRHPDLCILMVGNEEAEPDAAYPLRCAFVTKESACESLVPTVRVLLARAGMEARKDPAI